MSKPSSRFPPIIPSSSLLYGRLQRFPSQSESWRKTLLTHNLPARFTQSSFNKDLNCSNAELVRLKSRSPPFVRDGIMFEPEMIDAKTAPECFEGNAKFQWLSPDGYCHLCQEPFSNASIHVGEREHQCMSLFVYLYTLFPHRTRNQWSAKRVLAEACHFGQREQIEGLTKHTAKISKKKFWCRSNSTIKRNDGLVANAISQLGHLVRCDPMTIEPSHLFNLDDKQRLDELEALMTFAATRDMEMMTQEALMNNHPQLFCDYNTKQHQDCKDDSDFTFSSNDDSSSLSADADVQQQQQQKRLPDPLIENETFETSSSIRASRRPTLFAHVLQSKVQIPLHSQGEKLFRSVISRMITEMFPGLSPVSFSQFEHKCYGRTNQDMLYCRLNIGKIQEMVGGAALATKDQRAYCVRNIFWELMVATEFRCDEVEDSVIVVVGREILRRLSFEMIYSMSMVFMNRAQVVVELLEHPGVEDLARLNSL